MFLLSSHSLFYSFFFNAPPTTEIYTLSLHDALPILPADLPRLRDRGVAVRVRRHLVRDRAHQGRQLRSEEHTSELQSPVHLVCRLLLEKKKNKQSILNKKSQINHRQTRHI